jgi:hypothetical protein
MWGVTRSLFNYLVPMYQDKQAEEEKRKEGNRPSQIGQVKGPPCVLERKGSRLRVKG